MSNLKHQVALDQRSNHIDELRADIATTLDALVKIADKLELLASTRQSVGLGFMTEQGRELANKQARLDRAAARGQHAAREHVGLKFLNAAAVLGTGVVAPPVTMTAVSAAAEIRFTLLHHLRRLARSGYLRALEEEQLNAEDHGICTWPRNLLVTVALDTDATTRVLAGRLEALLDGYANRSGLEGILRDFERLEATARDVVDGPAKSNHPDPCPWCGQDSLVIHHREDGRDVQVIRCEGRHACRCNYEFCDCHRNPTRNRHEWINSGRAAHTWNELHNLQTARKEAEMAEQRATEILEQIRELHQPITLYRSAGNCPHPEEHAPTYIPDERGEALCPTCADEGQVCVTCYTRPVDDSTYPEPTRWPCPTAQLTSPDTEESHA